MVESGNLPQSLLAKGRSMPRRKYQRPEVYAWKGKSAEKFWKAEWRSTSRVVLNQSTGP